MEISSMRPEERVFRIDDECYIIYLGTSVADLKPFLRIGNSERITKDIIEATYNIVLTDSLTGNPALEPQNMNRQNTAENRYVGDPKITAGLLKFITEFNIKDGTVSTIEDVQKAHQRAEVHFFHDGNLQVLHDRNVLFDLRKRERSDLHFIERARMLRDIHTRNPLRYRPEDLKGPGFVLIDGCPILFHDGSLLTIGIPLAYFMDFVNAGIDPDLIDTIVTDDIGGAFFRLLKRKWSTRRPLRILSGNTSLIKHAAGLFMETEAGKLKTDVVSFGQDEKRTVSGYRLERDRRGIEVTHRDIPMPLYISTSSSREAGQLRLNPERATLAVPGRGAGGDSPVPQGVVHCFSGEIPALTDLVEHYCRDLIDLIEDLLRPEESTIAKLIDQILDDLVARKLPAPMLNRVRGSIKKVSLKAESPLFYLLNNLAGVIALMTGNKKEENENIASLQTLREIALKKVSSLDRVTLHLPVTGDVFTGGEKVTILYRPVRGAASRDTFALTRELVRDVEERADTFIRELEQEHVRLRTFMAALRGEPSGKTRRMTRRMTKKAGAAAVSGGIAAEGIAAPRVSGPGGGRKKERGTEGEVTTPEERQAYTTAPVQRVAYTKGIRGPLKFIIPAAVIVLAAIVLALIFLFPNVIGRKDGSEGGSETASLVDKQAADQEGMQYQGSEETEEGVFKPDESLQERGIPQSALTDRRTVIYRGLVEITLLDIYLLTNEIAVSNGYRRLDSVEQVGKDPDWIYPGNLLVLPDETTYSVVKGDAIWYIANRFIIKRLEEDWERYTALKNEINTGVQDTPRKEELKRELRYIRERSYSENFRREIDRIAAEL